MQSPPVKRAIISVSDKLGLAGFARRTGRAGVGSSGTGGTGGTWKVGIAVPTCRLHRISGNDGRAIEDAASMSTAEFHRATTPDMAAVAEFGIKTFELVVVNSVIRADGRPRMRKTGDRERRHQRADHGRAPQRHDNRDPAAIFRDPRRSPPAAASLELRKRLAARPPFYGPIRRGDRRVPSQRAEGPFPGHLALALTRKSVLRYGENPHQQAALYAAANAPAANLVSAMQLNGKELSYNNLLDLDSARAIVRGFSEPAASVIKHNNPCGAAVGATLAEALEKVCRAIRSTFRIGPGAEPRGRRGRG